MKPQLYAAKPPGSSKKPVVKVVDETTSKNISVTNEASGAEDDQPPRKSTLFVPFEKVPMTESKYRELQKEKEMEKKYQQQNSSAKVSGVADVQAPAPEKKVSVPLEKESKAKKPELKQEKENTQDSSMLQQSASKEDASRQDDLRRTRSRFDDPRFDRAEGKDSDARVAKHGIGRNERGVVASAVSSLFRNCMGASDWEVYEKMKR